MRIKKIYNHWTLELPDSMHSQSILDWPHWLCMLVLVLMSIDEKIFDPDFVFM